MLTHFTTADLDLMESRYRATFINSLGGFKSVVLAGSHDKDRKPNLAIFNSFFHIGANPPLCGLIFRPDKVARHTLENIIQTGEYTINHIHAGILSQAHQTSARYGRGISEFTGTGLNAEYKGLISAPYVGESHLSFGVRLAERVDLKINGTTIVIGRITEVFVPGECIMADGFIDLEKAGTVTNSGLDSYHTTHSLGRLPYPKLP